MGFELKGSSRATPDSVFESTFPLSHSFLSLPHSFLFLAFSHISYLIFFSLFAHPFSLSLSLFFLLLFAMDIYRC